MYDEQRPRRAGSTTVTTSTAHNINPEDWRKDWGVDYHQPASASAGELHFPETVHAMTHAAAETVAAVIYDQARLDPNVVVNAVLGGTYLHGRRPVRRVFDAGRIGIEIDFCLQNNSDATAATRYASLVLAGKLSQDQTWNRYEEEKDRSKLRPVAVYFNTLRQALAASQQLLIMKRLERETAAARIPNGKQAKAITKDIPTIYDAILIRCLCQGDKIPNEMLLSGNKRQQRKKNEKLLKMSKTRSLQMGLIDATAGLVMIVQPTDYNDEYQPPGPSVCAVEALQRLATAAAIELLPVIVVSPRFLKQQEYAGWDQSGYQQSSVYAGLEPPKGPTPWIMRDFTPPVFCWVSNALPLLSKRNGDDDDMYDRDNNYSHMALLQSVLHRGHAWHLFAATTKDNTKRQGDRYKYIASTKSAAGRPTRQLMRLLFQEYQHALHKGN